MKKKICANCQFFKQPGRWDVDIPGQGHWCSNWMSARRRTRVGREDSCPQFGAGKRAPIYLRLAVSGLGTVISVVDWLRAGRRRRPRKK
jgi:hypothetical protein